VKKGNRFLAADGVLQEIALFVKVVCEQYTLTSSVTLDVARVGDSLTGTV
jgi:hypothetical protein